MIRTRELVFSVQETMYKCVTSYIGRKRKLRGLIYLSIIEAFEVLGAAVKLQGGVRKTIRLQRLFRWRGLKEGRKVHGNFLRSQQELIVH